MLKIRFEKDKDVELHAKLTLRAIERSNMLQGEIVPRGIPSYLTMHPRECQECGQTFWVKENWSYLHKDCPGSPDKQHKERTGFGF